MNAIPKLTEKEEEVMAFFWQRGTLTIREVVAAYPEPQPHFNTVSTYVHILEKKAIWPGSAQAIRCAIHP